MQTEFQRNLLAVYGRASDTDLVAGRMWYQLARETCTHLAVQHKVLDAEGKPDARRVAGVVAALSPQQSWKVNLANAAYCLERKRFTGHTKANTTKARRIYQGEEPLKVLGGLKVRAFYKCIVFQETDAVCIDRHAYSILLGRDAMEKEQRQMFDSPRINGECQRAYRDVARALGLLPSELQAITWVTWRREKGITD